MATGRLGLAKDVHRISQRFTGKDRRVLQLVVSLLTGQWRPPRERLRGYRCLGLLRTDQGPQWMEISWNPVLGLWTSGDGKYTVTEPLKYAPLPWVAKQEDLDVIAGKDRG